MGLGGKKEDVDLNKEKEEEKMEDDELDRVDSDEERIIQAGHEAVKQLIKVAEEEIIKPDPDDELAADRLKNAAGTKKLAIFDAFEILNRIEAEENLLNETPVEVVEPKSFKGFAEGRSK